MKTSQPMFREELYQALLCRKAGETIVQAVDRWVHEYAAAAGLTAEEVADAMAPEGVGVAEE